MLVFTIVKLWLRRHMGCSIHLHELAGLGWILEDRDWNGTVELSKRMNVDFEHIFGYESTHYSFCQPPYIVSQYEKKKFMGGGDESRRPNMLVFVFHG